MTEESFSWLLDDELAASGGFDGYAEDLVVRRLAAVDRGASEGRNGSVAALGTSSDTVRSATSVPASDDAASATTAPACGDQALLPAEPASGTPADSACGEAAERRNHAGRAVVLPEGVVLGEEVLSRRIDECLALAPRVRRALVELGCDTIEDLLDLEASGLTAEKDIGGLAPRGTRGEFSEKIVGARDDKAPATLPDDGCADAGTVRLGYETRLVVLPEGCELAEAVRSRDVGSVLDLTARSRVALENLGCLTVGDLLSVETADFEAQRGVGARAVERVRSEFYSKVVKADEVDVQEEFLLDPSTAADLPDWAKGASASSALDLAPAVAAALENFGVRTVGDLFDVRLADFLGQRSVGEVSVRQIREAVGFLGRDDAGESGLGPSAAQRYTRRPLLDSRIELVGDAASAAQDEHSPRPDLARPPADELDEAIRLFRQSDSYEDLIDQCLADSLPRLDGRDCEVFRLCSGVGCEALALRATSERLGLSGERVRQIQKRLDDAVDLSRSLRFLPVRSAVLAAACELGGSGETDSLVEAAARRLGPKGGSLGDVVQFVPEVELSGDGASFFVAGLPCKSCAALSEVAKDLVRSRGYMDAAAFAERAGCLTCGSGFRATPQLACSVTPLAAASGLVGAKDNPRLAYLRKPTNKRALIRMLFAEADGELSCERVVELAAGYGVKLTKAHVASTVQGFPECMLWGRGVYIHERNVTVPEELVGRVADCAAERIAREGVPLVGAGGLYALFADELADCGVPGEQALFSLLRRAGDPRLELREYPWVCDRASIGDRTTFAKYFYSVLEQNGGYITDARAEEIARKTMAQSFALDGLSEYTPYALRANGGWYDLATMEFDRRGVASLAVDVATGLCDDDVISAKKVFEDNRERCRSCGVWSWDMLFRLLEMMEGDVALKATHMPHLVKSQRVGLTAGEAIACYIRGCDSPVSADALRERFVVERGLNKSYVCDTALLRGDIVKVGEECYWSRSRAQGGEE